MIDLPRPIVSHIAPSQLTVAKILDLEPASAVPSSVISSTADSFYNAQKIVQGCTNSDNTLANLTRKIRFLVPIYAAIALVGCHQETGGVSKLTMSKIPIAVEEPQEKAIPETNFDLKSNKLGENFRQSDPWRLMKTIESLSIDRQKGEYESSKEFNARIAALKNTVLYDEVRLGGGFAFSAGKRFHYEADKGYLDFGINEILADHSDQPFFEIYKSNLDSSDYPALNKYFKDKGYWPLKHTKNIYLALNNVHGSIESIRGKYKIDRSKAKDIATNLDVIFVGSLEPPYFWSDEGYPHERNEAVLEHRFSLNFKLHGMWLVNRSTGEILTRQYMIKKY